MSAPPPRFVEVDGRRVAWRATGTGPAALLIHGSPQSSRALAGLGQAVAAAGLCAIMPDTPGAGHSEPLPLAGFQIADLAEALAGFADSIGLGRFPLYGNHTGAAIAYAFAARFPERVTGLVLDGLAAWSETERALFKAEYAPPFLPAADGSHMTWLWSRMEAQSTFFPWYQQTSTAWRNVDLSPPWHLHRNAMDMLDAGDAYRGVYQASLAFNPGQFVVETVPAQFLTLASDVLRNHATRPGLSHLKLTLFEEPPLLWQGVAAALAATPGDVAPAFPEPGFFWRGALAGSGKPLVLLHPAGASSRVFEIMLPELLASGPVLAFDLPGHGFNESVLADSAPGIAGIMAAQCSALGLDTYTVAGRRFGGVIAQAMANADIKSVDLGTRATAPDLASNGAIGLEPVWDGGHLLRAWRVAWRQAIWDPWYRTDTAAAQPPEDIDPKVIHAAAVDLLRAGPAWQTANRIEAAAGQAEIILPGPANQWPASLLPWR
jgi:pimeloyl-ACP methyl ester carboxylesterase